MCELLGVCFEKMVGAEVSIREFALRDFENADGWGLAWYHDHSITVVKEPLSWRKSKYARFLVSYEHLQSHIFIGHVRHATVGGPPKHADTHPFSRELMGRQYCFAHNGTLSSVVDELPLDRFRPIGDTDSEHAFCYLLDHIAQRGNHLERAADFRWLHGQLQALNELGKFNCVFSDGARLFCYHDVNGFKGLHMHGTGLRDHEKRHLDDPGVSLDFASEAPTDGVIVATRPLNEFAWHPLRTGELIVVEAGQWAFSSERRGRASASPAAGVH